MNKWGITGWQPNWLDSSESLLCLVRQHIMIGSKVSQTITLWEGDEWFEDAPVILVIDGVQHEFCSYKIGEFSYTINTIDTSQPVDWCNEPKGFGNLQWKTNTHPNLQGMLNKNIIDMGVFDYLLDKGLQEMMHQDWVLTGVYFQCDDFYAEIYNALDCNDILNTKNTIEGLRYFSRISSQRD